MPIDPAGTAPGLTPKTEEPPKVHIRCKNPTCSSILAIELKLEGMSPGHRLYQCCVCKRTHGVSLGGAFEL
jgi:hypothetical protein